MHAFLSEEAMANGQIRVIPRLQDFKETHEIEDENSEETAIASHDFMHNLLFVDRCNVCYEDQRPGFVLACKHCQCVSTT